MKVAVYLAGVPLTKNEIKVAVLKRFAQGVIACGDQVELVSDFNLVKSDISVIQGFVNNDVSRPHLQLRKNVLENSQKTIIIDSNLFQFADITKANYYLRYSINGVFPNTGFYFDNKIDFSRWQQIKNILHIDLEDYKTNQKNILVCLQRIEGWSMNGVSVQSWLNDTVSTIQKYSTKPIIIRKHPGDRNQSTIVIPKNTTITKNELLIDDLRTAHAMVTFNSSPGVASLIKGVPVFVTDPVPQRSQTWPICNTDLSNIETPIFYDRLEWINRISQSHWNDQEVESGVAWKFMKDRIF